MEITGIVLKKTSEIKVGKKEMPKVTLVVSENEHTGDNAYRNNSIAIDFLWDKVDLIKDIIEDDLVTVSYNTKATEYNDRVYNNITGRKIDITEKKEETDENLPF